MAIYTDGIHLMADTENELHEFASKIGIRRKCFIDHKHKHYALIGDKVKEAIINGAKVVDTKELINMFK